MLRQLDVSLDVRNAERLPSPDTSMVFVSNHPLGGLDGIALVKILGEMYGDDRIRVLVNDLLMAVTPLKHVFLPINKFGRQARQSAVKINEAYASDAQICVFPAGLVSRLDKQGNIRDLEWQKAFVAKALEYGRTVVPVRFEGENSPFFYKFARLRKRLGLKINIEQAFLPREIFNTRGKRFRITFGDPIPCEALAGMGSDPQTTASIIRESIYKL